MGDVGEELHCDAAWMREVLEEQPEAACGLMWYYDVLKHEGFWGFFIETILPNIEIEQLTYTLRERVISSIDDQAG